MYHIKDLEVGTAVIMDPTIRGNNQAYSDRCVDGYIGVIVDIANCAAVVQDVITHRTYSTNMNSLMTVNEFAEWVKGVNTIDEHYNTNYYGSDITVARRIILQIPAAIDINRDIYKEYIYCERDGVPVNGFDIAKSFEIVRYLKIVEIDHDDDDDDDDWDDDFDPIIGLNNEPDVDGDE